MNHELFSARIEGELELAKQQLTTDEYLQVMMDVQAFIAKRALEIANKGDMK